MSFRRALYFSLIFFATAVIVIRRWLWDQVPSQVPTVIVQLTLALSLAWMVREIYKYFRSSTSPMR